MKQGHWKILEPNIFEMAYGITGYEPVYKCSECGGITESYLRYEEPIEPDILKFCPHCGANMEGKEKNDD